VGFTVLISRRASRAISARRLALLIVFTSAKKRRQVGEKDFKLLGLRLIIQNACFVHCALSLVRSIVFLWDLHWISVATVVTEPSLTLQGCQLMSVGGDQQ
jgi:hypothetical protein